MFRKENHRSLLQRCFSTCNSTANTIRDKKTPSISGHPNTHALTPPPSIPSLLQNLLLDLHGTYLLRNVLNLRTIELSLDQRKILAEAHKLLA